MRLILLFTALAAFASFNAAGMFMFYETKLVPLDRLFANLQRRLDQQTNDYEVTYQLARLHAMAYSTDLEQMSVRKDDEAVPVFGYPGSDSGVPASVTRARNASVQQAAAQHLTHAIALYEKAIQLLKQSTNLTQGRWLILPTQLGLAWCLDQAGRRDVALQAYRKGLRLAWKMEVIGDFDLKEWVKDTWNDVRPGRNPVHPHRRGYIGPGVCYSQEFINYLLKLLDPVKDAKEITQLKQDEQTLLSMGRAITPIIVPLQPDCSLADLVDPGAQVAFDLDGSGLARKWGWIKPQAAWLVYDPVAAGRISSGLQLFGNVTFWIFWHDGYEALRALDDNGDGILSGAELQGMAVWIDANSNGVSEHGEVIPVEAIGITSLSCTRQEGVSGDCWNPAGVTFKDGSTWPTFDGLRLVGRGNKSAGAFYEFSSTRIPRQSPQPIQLSDAAVPGRCRHGSGRPRCRHSLRLCLAEPIRAASVAGWWQPGGNPAYLRCQGVITYVRRCGRYRD